MTERLPSVKRYLDCFTTHSVSRCDICSDVRYLCSLSSSNICSGDVPYRNNTILSSPLLFVLATRVRQTPWLFVYDDGKFEVLVFRFMARVSLARIDNVRAVMDYVRQPRNVYTYSNW